MRGYAKPWDSIQVKQATIGVSDHGGWAVLVTVGENGKLLDRRQVELVDEGLPKIPHHHEAQKLPIEEALELVDRVRISAERLAKLALDAVTSAVPEEIGGIALRECPAWLPPTVAERITNYRAQNVADWVMYRKALAAAAEERGWAVHWYDTKTVLDTAARALQIEDMDAYLAQLRKSIGAPWDKDHRIAMAAAISGTRSRLPSASAAR